MSTQQTSFEHSTKFAVVGATDSVEELGYKLLHQCIALGRDVKPINPNHAIVQGRTSLASLHDLPDPTERAVFIAVSRTGTQGILRDALSAGVPYIWLFNDRVDAACQAFIQTSGLASRCIITGARARRDGEDTCNPFVPPFLETGMTLDLSPPVPTGSSELKRKADTNAPSSPTKIRKTVHCSSWDDEQFLEKKFLEYSRFGVVGASDNMEKWGAKIFRCLKEKKKDVVPINDKRSTIQGDAAFKTISDLPDPKTTAISIVVPPEQTLKVLEAAKKADIPMMWLQPHAENEEVLKYIESNGLKGRCIFSRKRDHDHTPEGDIVMMNVTQPEEDDDGNPTDSGNSTNGSGSTDGSDSTDGSNSTDGGNSTNGGSKTTTKTSPGCRTADIIDAVTGELPEPVLSAVRKANTLIRPCLFARLSA